MNYFARRVGLVVAMLAVLQVLLSVLSREAEAQLLGKIAFPNSGAAEAQADFIEGVLNLHNFEYEEANAAKMSGDTVGASNAYFDLTQIWHAASPDTPGYTEAVTGAKN